MSGVLRHYLLMARAWLAQGHEVDFLVASAAYPQIRANVPECGLLCSDAFFDASSYLDQTWRYLPAYAWRMLSAIWLQTPKPYDVVYASNLLFFEVVPALILSRRLGAKCVVKIQHLLHGHSGRISFFDKMFLLSERWCMRLIGKYASGTMCLSQTVAKAYALWRQRWGWPRHEVQVVGCGLDFSAIDQTLEEAKQYDVILLGRVHEQKGVFDLLACWRHVCSQRPNSTLIVVGEGPHRKALMAQFAEAGLSRHVTFAGGVSEAVKNGYLRKARVGLSLSFEEGWGLSVTEMLASGLPVVAYELPVFRELFESVIQLVPTRFPQEAAMKIIHLLEDPRRARHEGIKGADFVRQFGYREVADQELDFIQDLPNPSWAKAVDS